VLRAGALGLPALLVACGPQAGAGPGQTRKEYVVAPILGAYGRLEEDISRGQPLAEFLARETGLAVRAYPPGDYARSMIGLKDGSLDFAFLPALLYLRARDESGVEPMFRTLRPGVDGRPVAAFAAMIAVRADSGINSVADLKGKRVVATDASDAAGWVMPAAHLKKNGLDPFRDVTVEYRRDGADALIQVLNRKADAAFAARQDLASDAVTKADPDAARTLKLLATIEGAPLEVVTARRGLDSRVLEKFRAAFKNLADPQKGVFTRDGKTQPILAQWGVSGLQEAKDADFTALREAAKSIGIKLK
jgi:phosphonate transport system substrate-binding protein